MISKLEALRRIESAVPTERRTELRPLDISLGAVLAEDIHADLDMPPFEKSSVDGWAIASAAHTPGATYRIVERVMAGQMPALALGPGETSKVMTGAPLPAGADAVVMVEEAEESAAAVTLSGRARPGQNVCHRAEDLARGDRVLLAGTRLDPAALGVLAMVGRDPVPVWAVPTVCVIPTGDELCAPEGPPPTGGRIRESNGGMLRAQVRGVSPVLRPFGPGIARDNRDSLSAYLDVGLGHDVLILSGGVSMGDLDLVGAALRERGLEVAIEKVAIKPGKPLLFGRVAPVGRPPCFVFGLPGNPVSSFVTFELFVKPFLRALLGEPFSPRPELAATFVGPRDLAAIPREQHVPCALTVQPDGGLQAYALEWHGSADLRGLVSADGLLIVPAHGAGLRVFDRGTVHRLNEDRAPRGIASRSGAGP